MDNTAEIIKRLDDITLGLTFLAIGLGLALLHISSQLKELKKKIERK